jgi:alpha-tubulin suppressor-like RCC1 family protein
MELFRLETQRESEIMIVCPYCAHQNPNGITTCRSCGAAVSGTSLQALKAGSSLQNGKYLINKPLAQGGFGIAYLASHVTLNQTVVIKELCPQNAVRVGNTLQPPTMQIATWGQAITGFIQEARTVASFSHPGIVKVQDVFEENNTAYFVMEYLQGQTLSERLQTGVLSESLVTSLARQISAALQEIHAKGLLHRDLKPDNVFLTNQRGAVLIDFGSARVFTGQTVQHTQILTQGYAPPEQYSAQARFGPYSDIYALGATLFTAFTGQIPPDFFARVNDVAMSFPNGVSSAWQNLINKTMQLKVDQRPQNVDEFLGLIPNSGSNAVKNIVNIPKPSLPLNSSGNVAKSTVNTPIPILNVNRSKNSQIETISGNWIHSLALKTDGSLWVFGNKEHGQLNAPSQVMTGVSSISAGGRYSLVLKTDNSLWVFGSNAYGQLGDGTNIYCGVPKQIMTGVLSISAGYEHSLALKADVLLAFGRNDDGHQLGDGTTINRSTPKQIMIGVLSVSAGGYHSLALKDDGSLWTFGRNDDGQLGDGTIFHRSTPKQLVIIGISKISAGGYHSLALKADGSLWTFGSNSHGQLGDTTTTNRVAPVQIMTGVSSISAGGYHSLALKTDGSLWVFGSNSHGQLGDGTNMPHNKPVQVMTKVSSVSAGGLHSLVLKMDGSLWVFGNNEYGQLGDGTYIQRNRPVQVMTDIKLP